MNRYLFDRNHEHSSCGVGFITNKHSTQTHQLLEHAHQALCKIPHRGGMSAEGIGDGAGVNIDLSVNFFRKKTNLPHLTLGEFGVANFFYPVNTSQHQTAEQVIESCFAKHGLTIHTRRAIDVNQSALNAASQKAQLEIKQVIFLRPEDCHTWHAFELIINEALSDIEYAAFTRQELDGFYPLSMSSRTQVLKGRLNSWEVVPYFKDLEDPEHHIHTLFFHTRFSTNTAPNPMFAQPFRRMAHNGELNTDRKNRLSEDAIARLHNKEVIFPKGQSDSARLDQTLARRIIEDQLDIDVAALAMMPPAWENDTSLTQNVLDMLEYFSLYEEKNDGPAALVFGDGVKVGARLDRLGLRPLRCVETHDYLAVMSEAGQIDFPPESVIRRSRIEAGGMIVFDHEHKEIIETTEILARMASKRDYAALLNDARIKLSDLPQANLTDYEPQKNLSLVAQHVAYSMNQESFKFMLDPMLLTGMEKISAMGFGLAPNALTRDEGGVTRYMSQRFAQVTNPPLDSIREADGMTLRVSLGAKPNISPNSNKQIVLESPILQPQQLIQIQRQQALKVGTIELLFEFDNAQPHNNSFILAKAINDIANQAEQLAANKCDLIILSDKGISHSMAAVPALLAVTAVNQRLIKQGLRFATSIICETGQAASTHDIACLLGFGASAVCPLTVLNRALELFNNEQEIAQGLNNFQKAVEKALMKTMGKFGLCTVESYIGGEFFEGNFLDTHDPILHELFPNIHAPVGGATFADIAQSAVNWHKKVFSVQAENQIPVLGLFKERAQGAGHSFGNTAVREYINMTEESIQYVDESELESRDHSVILPQDNGYKDLGYQARTPAQIDDFKITKAYREFCENLYVERFHRPAALRDVLSLPLNFNTPTDQQAFEDQLSQACVQGSPCVSAQGIVIEKLNDASWRLSLKQDPTRISVFASAIEKVFYLLDVSVKEGSVYVVGSEDAPQQTQFFNKLTASPDAINLELVQPAHEITAKFASGAMSHGALVARAHEAVAHGTNIAGALSNSGEGGESSSRYNTVKASKIKQFASGRFGVWTGYLADPALQEIEIKIGQGAKPGEGGQLPAHKVNVEIAAARGGTPGVELVSPPPHHDTYSIEDLGQLIHDAKAARVKVVVKLVSSEGVGTIAVGVAKAGADVINIAGSTGGTGAAQVTSLKHTGRAADIGIAEVHQALSENGLREKITLRCSNAHQTGRDVVKSAILGGDSFEFGTTALMMLKCVMAKNCHLKCPAGLTTNPEVYQGDPRALAQYFMNMAHEAREVLAAIGYRSLQEVRGKTHLLHLVDHPMIVGKLDMTALLQRVDEVKIAQPIYLEANFRHDDALITEVNSQLIAHAQAQFTSSPIKLNNRDKTTGGQLSVDVERTLNYQLSPEQIAAHPALMTLKNGRVVLHPDSILVNTYNSAGQSYGAFNNSGCVLTHTGTCNDGVGKGCSGGKIIVLDPNKQATPLVDNVLVGNFALFGATGGQLYIEGQAGDRFGVRNSGAVAVVEGVGDFCCEYMTNGTIINLGSFGKGFGNGMSGGTAYQYDPTGNIAQLCSNDSVQVMNLTDDNAFTEGHNIALKYHLEQHVINTDSAKAKALLAAWEQEKAHFYVLIPKALYTYHCREHIAQSAQRKSMLDELSESWGKLLLTKVKHAYAQYQLDSSVMFDGQVPQYGDRDTHLIYQYIIHSGVIHQAFKIAQSSSVVCDGDASVSETVQYLIDVLDKKLLETIIKDAKEALASYDDDALISLLAQKRIKDYKDSLTLREVWDTHAFSTSVWIIERDREIQAQLAHYQCFEELLATHYCHVFSETIKEIA